MSYKYTIELVQDGWAYHHDKDGDWMRTDEVLPELTEANARIKELEARLKPMAGIDDVEAFMDNVKEAVTYFTKNLETDGDFEQTMKYISNILPKKDEAKSEH